MIFRCEPKIYRPNNRALTINMLLKYVLKIGGCRKQYFAGIHQNDFGLQFTECVLRLKIILNVFDFYKHQNDL